MHGEVLIAARIRTSTDGQSFDDGRVFRGASERDPISAKAPRRIFTRRDLVVMEVGGERVQIDASVKNAQGDMLAKRTYEIPAFAQQIVSLANHHPAAATVEITVRGNGAVIVQPEGDSTRVTNRLEGLPASFKAAPFQEPLTGLVTMRDRWYDPSSGTFLTPDPERYADSSNPYLFGRGDPVNHSDPTGRHSFVKRNVNGLEFELLAPDPEEVRQGVLGLSGSFVNPLTGKRETFSWDQHQSELLLMQARWGNPLMQDAFAQLFGMAHDQVDVSGVRLYWNSLWHHKTDIALSAGFTVAMLAPRPPIPAPRATPKVNLVQRGGTPPAGATSTLVPGGGLVAHERAGGHLIARHVGQTPAQLRARLAAEPRVSAVSTFSDRSVAESAVSATLQANQTQIATWMQSTSARPLVLNSTLGRPTGISLARGALTPTTVSGVRLVLVKDATMPMGYRVHTGFPTP
jgi:RHS repeat-associated protein